jgi:hypothetical protein
MPNNYVLLEKITVGAAGAASVTFANIPQTGYTDLKIAISSRQSVAEASGGYYYDVTFNSTSANRSGIFLRNHNGSVTSTAYTLWGLSNPSDYTTNTFSSCELYIANYTSSNNKSAFLDSTNENNATGIRQIFSTGLWSDSTPINSVTLTPGGGSFVANSTFYLYGVAKLGTTPAIAPKAAGGDIVMTDGTYWYHAFRSSGTFTPQIVLSCDVLQVAGGGGAGPDASSGQGAGGGAGGIFYATSQSVASSPVTITVGAGGVGKSANSGVRGDNGSNSTFGALTAAIGGGGGGPGQSTLGGASGGSGGGGGGGSTSTGAGGSSTQTGTGGTGYGNAGGAGVSSAAGGGGGSGAAGGNGSGSVGGTGGIGLNTWSSWASATGTGDSGYFASGGNGWSTAASRPLGGGGPSSTVVATASGYANTGGGGGGFAGNGGSGIVIVRYAV